MTRPNSGSRLGVAAVAGKFRAGNKPAKLVCKGKRGCQVPLKAKEALRVKTSEMV